MAGIFFQPQQPDYRGLWDWNPVQTFITAKNELESADLKRAESERLKAKTDLDMRVTEQMLPLEVNLAKAKIAKTIAEQGYLNSRANKDIENSTAELYYQGYQSGDLDRLLPTSAPSSSPRSGSSSVLDSGSVLSPSSGGAGGDFSSFSLPSSLTSFAPNDQPQVLDEIARKIPDEQVAAVTNPPPDRMMASLNGAGTPVDLPRSKRVTNKADWDDDPRTVGDLETSNPLTSLQIPEEKRKELAELNKSSGALNPSKEEVSAAPKPQGVGELLISQYGKIRRAEEIAGKSKGDAKARMLGLAYGGRDDLGAQVASALNLADRSLGSNAAEILLKSPNGQIRDAGAINKIVALVDKGLGVGEAADIYEATRKNELANMFKDPAKDDSTENYQKAVTTAKTLHEMASNTEDPDRSERYRREADALINNYVPPQVRRQMYIQDQADIFTGINPQSWSDGTRNYKGVTVSKEMPASEKITVGERFNKEAGRAFPVVSGKVVGSELDVDDEDIAAVSAWFQQKGLPVPEGNFFAGVRIKTDKGLEAYPVQLNLKTKGAFTMVNLPSQSAAPKPKSSTSTSEPEKTPNKSGKTVYDAARPYFQESPSLMAGRVVDRGMDAVLNAGDYAATAIRNRAVAPAAEFIAGTLGEDLDLGKTANARPQDRSKQLTPEERIQIIERLTGGPLQGVGREIIRDKFYKQ